MKVGRQRALEFEISAAGGMAEAEPPRVQGLARKAGDPGVGRTAAGSRAKGPCAIEGVADQRMAAMREMDPDLMGAAGRQAAFDERGRAAKGARGDSG